jgi:hypothetical protein
MDNYGCLNIIFVALTKSVYFGVGKELKFPSCGIHPSCCDWL